MRAAAALLLGLALSGAARAEVASETIVFLQPDGRSYLMLRSMHTAAARHSLLLDKRVTHDDLRHVAPREYTWDESDAEHNRLTFNGGSFSVLYPGRFGTAELTETPPGRFSFRSWNGERSPNGRYGIWYAPGNFDRFVYSWVLPEGYEPLVYEANQPGSWVRRGRSLSWHGADVNNLSFELEYRKLAAATAPPAEGSEDCDDDGVSNRLDSCPRTPAGTAVDGHGCPDRRGPDADSDGIAQDRDLCPDTPPGARVDQAGCPLDTDRDGVPDGIDRCLATPEGRRVDARGCASRASQAAP